MGAPCFYVNIVREDVGASKKEKCTIKYPPAHPVTIMPIATPTLRLPNTDPTTVGMVLKKPPLAAPLIMANAINGPRVLDTGHMTNMLIALSIKEMNNVLTGPIQSDISPQPKRPTAEEKLNPATRPAPAEGDNPREFEYNGKKNGGTKSGKVPTAPARKRVEN